MPKTPSLEEISPPEIQPQCQDTDNPLWFWAKLVSWVIQHKKPEENTEGKIQDALVSGRLLSWGRQEDSKKLSRIDSKDWYILKFLYHGGEQSGREFEQSPIAATENHPIHTLDKDDSDFGYGVWFSVLSKEREDLDTWFDLRFEKASILAIWPSVLDQQEGLKHTQDKNIIKFPKIYDFRWGKLIWTFLPNDQVRIGYSDPNIKRIISFSDLGFRDEKSSEGKPNRLWRFFKIACTVHGWDVSMDNKKLDQKQRDNLKHTISGIRIALKKTFQTHDNPFRDFKKGVGWTPKFIIRNETEV